MGSDSQAVIQALVNAELLLAKGGRHKSVCHKCVVAVSRDCGTDGEYTAGLLADELGLRCFDRELLEEIGRAAGVEPYLFKALDEKVRGLRTNWLERIVTRRCEFSQRYRENLVNVVLGITRTGGVIVGRGANFILDKTRAFRVRIVGPLEERARRYASREGIGLAEARARVEEINDQRRGFIREMFQRDIDDPTAYDLVLNTERLEPRNVVDTVIACMRSCGYPGDAGQAPPAVSGTGA